MRILLVEDNADDSALVQSFLLESDGPPVEVERVIRVSEALEHLSGGGIELILLDLGLPDAEGMDAVEQLADDEHDVPVVVLTGLADEGKAIEALRHGAQDYLLKNHMNGEWLRSAMRHAIERHRLLRELAALQQQVVESARIRALAETAGAAAHEINNPLTAITGTLELLLDSDGLTSDDREMLAVIREAAARIGGIVRKMGQTRRYATKKYIQNTDIVDFEASAGSARE